MRRKSRGFFGLSSGSLPPNFNSRVYHTKVDRQVLIEALQSPSHVPESEQTGAWTLFTVQLDGFDAALGAGKPIFTLPRAAVIRRFVVNHLIHHRAHLCVYLRLNDIAVPGMYHPSGDE